MQVRSFDSGDSSLGSTVKAAPVGDPWIGRTLKKYTLIARIGQGGMGIVYLAEDHVLKRVVAIKLIGAAMVNEPKAFQRFLREARTAAQLQHANAVAIYDIDEDQGTHFLVME